MTNEIVWDWTINIGIYVRLLHKTKNKNQKNIEIKALLCEWKQPKTNQLWLNKIMETCILTMLKYVNMCSILYTGALICVFWFWFLIWQQLNKRFYFHNFPAIFSGFFVSKLPVNKTVNKFWFVINEGVSPLYLFYFLLH